MDKSPLTAAAIICGALIATALVVGGLATASFTTSVGHVRHPGLSVGPTLIMFLTLWAVSALGAATLGIVWHAIALSRRWTNVFAYVVAGLLLGAGFPAALTAPLWVGELARPSVGEAWGAGFAMIFIAGGAVLGPLTALFAWLIRRPDRDTPANLPTSAP